MKPMSIDREALFQKGVPTNVFDLVFEIHAHRPKTDNLQTYSFWRVKIDGDSVELRDFTMPRYTDTITKVFKRNGLPSWLSEPISVLSICEDGVFIEGVGKKVSKDVYYIEDNGYNV